MTRCISSALSDGPCRAIDGNISIVVVLLLLLIVDVIVVGVVSRHGVSE